MKCPSHVDPVDGSTADNAYYYLNPHMAYFQFPGSTGMVIQPWWHKIQGFGKPPRGIVQASTLQSPSFKAYAFPPIKYALACDGTDGTPSAPNTPKTPNHSWSRSLAWNLLYADGSVRSVVVDRRVGRDSGGGSVSPSPPNRQLDLLGYLERAAEGVPVGNEPQFSNEYDIAPLLTSK
jgi:hypothetical protein